MVASLHMLQTFKNYEVNIMYNFMLINSTIRIKLKNFWKAIYQNTRLEFLNNVNIKINSKPSHKKVPIMDVFTGAYYQILNLTQILSEKKGGSSSKLHLWGWHDFDIQVWQINYKARKL